MSWTEPKDWTPGEVVTAQDLDTHLKDNLNAVLPLGTYILVIKPYTTGEFTQEQRWIQCNGAPVSRATYSQLNALLASFSPAYPFGAGDGSTTFNLPDLRGRIPVAEGEHADVVNVGQNDAKGITLRSVKHFHQAQYGANSVGGTIPVPPAFDSTITRTFPTSPGTSTGFSSLPQDAPAYLVAGSWFLKYRS